VVEDLDKEKTTEIFEKANKKNGVLTNKI